MDAGLQVDESRCGRDQRGRAVEESECGDASMRDPRRNGSAACRFPLLQEGDRDGADGRQRHRDLAAKLSRQSHAGERRRRREILDGQRSLSLQRRQRAPGARSSQRRSATSGLRLGTAGARDSNGGQQGHGARCRPAQCLEADDVVLAVPPSTWHNIRFSPGLPRVLRPQMGVNVKYLAGVKRRFWAKSRLVA